MRYPATIRNDAVAGEARDLPGRHRSDLAEADFRHHVFELRADDGAGRRAAKIVIDDLDLAPMSAEAFLPTLDEARPDCIVSEVRMPGLSGLDLQRELNSRDAALPVILITAHGDVAMAVDFIEKPFDHEQLIASIGTAIDHNARSLSEQAEVSELLQRAAELPERQRQVMNLVAEGLSNEQIAYQLGISARTVENYRTWVMKKMHVDSVSDLVRKTLLRKTHMP